MKTIEEILNNYEEYKTSFDDRFGRRFTDFLTQEQAKKIGWVPKEGCEWPKPKEWTRENILAQLAEDVKFGSEKAYYERGISSGMMFDVVLKWNNILEEGLEHWPKDYDDYGMSLFRSTADKYGFKLYSGWYEND